MPRGGKRPGAGRPSKDKENRIRDFSISAMEEVFGSEQAAMEHAARNAQKEGKEGYQWFKLLLAYAYGNPKDTMEVSEESRRYVIKLNDE